MAINRRDVIIETPMEARQAEPGPSILLILVVSVSVAVAALAVVWFLFFARSRIKCGPARCVPVDGIRSCVGARTLSRITFWDGEDEGRVKV